MDKQIKRHWIYVAQHFLLDVILFLVAFAVGTLIRFGEDGTQMWVYYLPAVVVGAFSFACCCYIFGLYSRYRVEHRFNKRLLLYVAAFHLAILLVVAVGYLNWSARIGRGVMTWSYAVGGALCLLHHLAIIARLRASRERVAFIVDCPFDEQESRILESIENSQLVFIGIIAGPDYSPTNEKMCLGKVADFENIIKVHRISRILCTEESLRRPKMRTTFCQLRYTGIRVSSLASLCEEVYQFVPLELVTPQWLLAASDLPQILYIRKMKRAFDVATSLLGLLVLGPLALLAALAIRLTSDGPVLYRQTRAGRFGKPFQVLKLRTMPTDAEAGGARWSTANDSRTTPLGRFLRRYRIDEIPQMINVLRGEMSFVGPRPERPEFVETLRKEIPYYEERMFTQPGITGWAQVRFPYGENVEDARRKLEYDLYYIKHMSVFLDIFILLDTVKIILKGGVSLAHRHQHPIKDALAEHRRSKAIESRKTADSGAS